MNDNRVSSEDMVRNASWRPSEPVWETTGCGRRDKSREQAEGFSEIDGIIRSVVRLVEPFVQLGAVGGVYGA